MKLSEQDADLFFELMWALQFFVSQQLQMLPDVTTVAQYYDRSSEEKFEVRQALFENIGLIDEFVQENPQQFSSEKLGIVTKWKSYVAGEFYIERLLKKYAIFIGSTEKVYGVIGLHDGFDEMLLKGQLPIYTRAVLLPFKGQIIYDGLLEAYSIFFGGNIKAELKEVYLRAKQNGEIIDSFEAGRGQAKHHKKKKPARDWTPILDELITAAKQLRGGSGQPPIYSPAFSLVRASLQLAHSAVSNPDDLEMLFKQMEKVDKALGKVEDAIYRM